MSPFCRPGVACDVHGAFGLSLCVSVSGGGAVCRVEHDFDTGLSFVVPHVCGPWHSLLGELGEDLGGLKSVYLTMIMD